MRNYDRNQPLIVIHIPKAGGNTSGRIFQQWFGQGFLRHYFERNTGCMPKKYDIFGIHTYNSPIVLHGHFNNSRHFGVWDYYPEVKQFITILRDPFELAVSNYYYSRKIGLLTNDDSRIPKLGIKEYLIKKRSYMFKYFPQEVTIHNYKDIMEENFVEVGITEYLDESMKRIAQKLGMLYDPKWLGHYNATERDEEVPQQLSDCHKITFTL